MIFKTLLKALIVTTALNHSAINAHAEKDMVGTVLGKPVYRQEITATDPYDVHYELQDIFVQPVLRMYYNQNKKSLEPTSKEITRFLLYCKKQHDKDLNDRKTEIIDKIVAITDKLKVSDSSTNDSKELVAELYYLKTELEPPGYDYAMFVLPYWKLQVHLYQNFGGGRILWQERGYEAFDAMLAWLEKHEQNGDFSLSDNKTRQALYYYWKKRDHGRHIIEDAGKIKREFLEPEWSR